MDDFEFLDVELDITVDDNWCTIVRAGVPYAPVQIEQPGCGQHYLHRRLGVGDNNYCIEGSRAEMRVVGWALRGGAEVDFRRVSVTNSRFSVDGSCLVALESPRNSSRPVLIPRARALALGTRILEVLGG